MRVQVAARRPLGKQWRNSKLTVPREVGAMKAFLAAAACAISAAAAHGEAPFDAGNAAPQIVAELPPYLQCVPVARQVSGIQIFGDAWTWWDQAEGRYAKGHTPRAGAVMAFLPAGNMTLGHVAAVSQVLDSRTVLLTHANWSPIDGRRGQVEHDVRAVDVSPANDWSQVRVWYAPIGDLGTTAWPVAGFIYPGKAPAPHMEYARQLVIAPIARQQAPAPGRDVIAEI
ncbi:MAG: CHAP domain-containing protein, partial [Croceibacterium sp.]